jgi:hypothetical protein
MLPNVHAMNDARSNSVADTVGATKETPCCSNELPIGLKLSLAVNVLLLP